MERVNVITLVCSALVALVGGSHVCYAKLAIPAPIETSYASLLHPKSSITHGSVVVEGAKIPYDAVAGTLVLDGSRGVHQGVPRVAMSYVAYFKTRAARSNRPITFLYNGGPGSSTVFLHLGAFGPKRVITADNDHTPPAPYDLVSNHYSLLDASDLVFVDAPGTGFGRLLAQGSTRDQVAEDRKRIAKSVWSIQGDALAFAQFIDRFLTTYNRWNSPKYIYGESYGTVRSAVLAYDLEVLDGIDINGVIMQSQVLDFPTSVETVGTSGQDLAYALALPSYAATAWYHHRLSRYNTAPLSVVLKLAIHFATGPYEQALMAGSSLSQRDRLSVAAQLHDLTGLPKTYLEKANLRVNVAMFRHELLNADGLTVGRLDSRFSGPSMNTLNSKATYDPFEASIRSAYRTALSVYMKNVLKFDPGVRYRIQIGGGVPDFDWSFQYALPGTGFTWPAVNVSKFLSDAMKYNPNLHLMLNEGFYDLGTPFYTAIYDDEHLQIPHNLERNITYAFYPSGHMIYDDEASLRSLHDNVARFIRETSSVHQDK